ncbi:TetR/AcrR family transcriptional regulator [Lentzea sp. BCCO 10_0798]|uniref:TetR/AcrR family transcriptional regulator n=1 Tax=Lentzea kristufekii TaxID=3095430 RepID=A0ABU4TJR3_9PSEU|nr:TetR/AcrR family transcriptional regulator [Lentzea sp. BCCO 10_0798]MDX8048488.1 TetR/AcrR family transcriptional regulator [Lentzea sp. BCCO 10_0798]
MTGQRRTRMTADERRESILAAATEVFAETGYLRGKTSAVARKIGVSEPVVFQNFGNKATLFAAVVDRAAEHICRMVDRVTTTDIPITGLLKLMLDPEHLQHVHSAGTVGAIFADAATITGEPDIEAATRRAVQRFAIAITTLLDRGRADGELRPDLDTEAAAWWLLSLVSSQRFRRATALDPDAVEARLADTTLAYLTDMRADSPE